MYERGDIYEFWKRLKLWFLLTFHRFDHFAKVCKSWVKTWWKRSKKLEENIKAVWSVCSQRTIRLRMQWIRQCRWHILGTIRDQRQSP